jgi:hypothetical protein
VKRYTTRLFLLRDTLDGKGASGQTSGESLSEATSPLSSLEVDLWGVQLEQRDLSRRLVVVANNYASKATIMVTSGTEGHENLRHMLF